MPVRLGHEPGHLAGHQPPIRTKSFEFGDVKNIEHRTSLAGTMHLTVEPSFTVFLREEGCVSRDGGSYGDGAQVRGAPWE